MPQCSKSEMVSNNLLQRIFGCSFMNRNKTTLETLHSRLQSGTASRDESLECYRLNPQEAGCTLGLYFEELVLLACLKVEPDRMYLFSR